MSNIILPADDPKRQLVIVDPDKLNKPYISLVGDTYAVLLSGEDTAGRFCLIDMHVPAGGGPPPHRHDFEETFTVLAGEVEMHFRGHKTMLRSGETAHIPANAPHQFRNTGIEPARLLCICSPAGQEEFFRTLGTPVPNRTSPSAKPTPESLEATKALAERLAPKYRTEFLESTDPKPEKGN